MNAATVTASAVHAHGAVVDLEGDPREPWIPPPIWLDQVLTSTGDRLNGTLLPGWRTKITASVAHLNMH